MSKTSLLLILSLLQALEHVKCENTECNGTSFEEHPEDEVANVGDSSIMFHCVPPKNFTPNDGYFYSWTFYSSTGGQEIIGENMPDRNYMISDLNGDLTITEVRSSHAGKYACRLPQIMDFCDNKPLFSCNATLSVRGPPEVNIPQGNRLVETLDDLKITGSVLGYPPPTIILVKVLENGTEREITHPRFMATLTDASLAIHVFDVRVEDGGMYKLIAENSLGRNESTFYIMTVGPNPPDIKTIENVVSLYNRTVILRCCVQHTAVDQSLNIVWFDPMNVPVPEVTETDASVYVNKTGESNSAALTINSLTANETGQYTCIAGNIKGNDTRYATIYGPPNPPAKPTIQEDSGVYTITWDRPTTSTPISAYRVYIFQAGTYVQALSTVVHVDESHTGVSYIVTDLPSGEYEVRISSLGGIEEVEGAQGDAATFNIAPRAPPSQNGPGFGEGIGIGTVIGALAVVIIIGILAVSIYMTLWFHKRHSSPLTSNSENSREGEIQIEKNPVYGIEGTRPLQQNNFDPDDYEVV